VPANKLRGSNGKLDLKPLDAPSAHADSMVLGIASATAKRALSPVLADLPGIEW
jgi:hypothetical protein